MTENKFEKSRKGRGVYKYYLPTAKLRKLFFQHYYNRITSNGITARFYKQGILLGDATSMIVPPENIKYLLALLNSKVSTFAMAFFNPTLAAQTGSLSKVPIKLVLPLNA